jgi:GNAT superfamily N-acetyltransferase
MSAPQLLFRRAHKDDLPRIVQMLAADSLGADRERCESPLPDGYFSAFAAIDADPNNELVVACLNSDVIGVLQMTFIPYLTYQGSWRALIEGVRIDATVQAKGYGTAMFRWAIARARERGCNLVQLTTDKSRVKAKRFYEALGFVASHEGMKLRIARD